MPSVHEDGCTGTSIGYVEVVLHVRDATGQETAVAVLEAVDRAGLERDCRLAVAGLPDVVAMDVLVGGATTHAASSELAAFTSRFVHSPPGRAFRWVGGPEPGVVEFAGRGRWTDGARVTGRVEISVSEELAF